MLNGDVFDFFVDELLEQLHDLGRERVEQVGQRDEAAKDALEDAVRLDELDNAVHLVQTLRPDVEREQVGEVRLVAGKELSQLAAGHLVSDARLGAEQQRLLLASTRRSLQTVEYVHQLVHIRNRHSILIFSKYLTYIFVRSLVS